MTSLSQTLRELESLRHNWDGRGSSAPTPEALDTASNIAVCPLGHGGVQLEIHAGRSNVEIEIDPHGTIIACSWYKG